MESNFQKEVDILLGFRQEHQSESSGMWGKFKTFVKKEIDEFKEE